MNVLGLQSRPPTLTKDIKELALLVIIICYNFCLFYTNIQTYRHTHIYICIFIYILSHIQKSQTYITYIHAYTHSYVCSNEQTVYASKYYMMPQLFLKMCVRQKFVTFRFKLFASFHLYFHTYAHILYMHTYTKQTYIHK